MSKPRLFSPTESTSPAAADPAIAPLEAWAKKLSETISFSERLHIVLQQLRQLPRGGDPSARLRILSPLWRSLTGNQDTPNLIDSRGNPWGTGDAKRAGMASAFRDILGQIQNEITRLLAAGGQVADDRLILTSDFAQQTFRLIGPNQPRLVVGWITALPEQHWLRSVLPEEEFYLQAAGFSPNVPALILGTPDFGSMEESYHPKPYYYLREALQWTKRMRAQQRVEEEARIEEQKRKAEELQRRREQHPAYIAEERDKLKARVAELEKLVSDKQVSPEPAAAAVI